MVVVMARHVLSLTVATATDPDIVAKIHHLLDARTKGKAPFRGLSQPQK